MIIIYSSVDANAAPHIIPISVGKLVVEISRVQ
jgi:hypothetical protein